MRTFTAILTIVITGIPILGGSGNGRLLFTRSEDFFWDDVCVMELDGSGFKNLTGSGRVPIDEDPTWSPDGRKIAFARSNFNDLPDIFVMNADGTGVVQLTESGHYLSYEQSYAPAWSPDGSKIAFLGIRNLQTAIYVMNADGKEVRRIVDDVYGGNRPAWSPDGRQIAFVNWEGIKTVDIQTGYTRKIVSYVWYDWEPGSPSWSPDGSMIAYTQVPYPETDAEGEDNDLFIVDLYTPSRRNLTNTPNIVEHSPSWLPDGSGLVYAAFSTGPEHAVASIYSIRTDGTGTTQLTFPVGVSDSQPSVQPVPTVLISGRVLTASGLGLRNAQVSLVDRFGNRRSTVTSSLGHFFFDAVAIDETFTIVVSAKRYRFTPTPIAVTAEATQFDIVASQ
jgi:tricorn protease-like protein